MAAALDGHAGLFDAPERFDIDLSGLQQGLAQGGPQLLIINSQVLRVHIKDLADQGEAVAVDAGGGNADQDVAGGDLLSGDQVLPVHDADRETGQVILILGIKAGHFRRLAADQGSAGLIAAVTDALDDLGDLFGIILAAGNVIQEKEGLAAGAGHVVDTHGDTVDAHRIMTVHQESQLELGPDAVGARQQDRVLHVLYGRQGESPREAAQAAQHFGPHGGLYIFLHQFNTFVSGFDIHAGALIIHALLL